MSAPGPFAATADAAHRLWESWLELARDRACQEQIPSLLELQTVCRETGCSLPELDTFACVQGQPPLLLVLGGDRTFASDVAALFGFSLELPDVPDVPVAWCVSAGKPVGVCLRHARAQRYISRKAALSLLSGELPPDDLVVIDERVSADAAWQFLWIPRPHHLRDPYARISEMEILFSQRAALLVAEHTPPSLRELLEEMGQKLWIVPLADTAAPDDRRKLLNELSSLLDDRPEDLEIRMLAAWRWLTGRLLEHITELKQTYRQSLSQFESKVNSAHHLLTQYRTNWIGGVRALVESHLQTRFTSSAFAAFLDAQKPGPRTASFVSALALTMLFAKLDEFVTDRMAEFVGGLGGLAAKLEFHRISLGDTVARWDMRSLAPRLETVLSEKQIFPAQGGKRGGLVGNLTGRKQAVLDERKGQIARATRLVVQFVEAEFASWARTLMNTMKGRITLQLTAALANRNLPDADGMQAALEGLARLEAMIQGRREAVRSPEAVTAEWMATLATRGWIPLYRPA